MTSTILSPIYPPFLPDSGAFLFAYLEVEVENDIALKEKARAKYSNNYFANLKRPQRLAISLENKLIFISILLNSLKSHRKI